MSSATKVAYLTREDAIWIVDSYMLDGDDTDTVLNAAALILEYDDDRARGWDAGGLTKPFIVTQAQAENLANKFKIAGPANHLALVMWRLVLEWRRASLVPELPDADPADDHAYKSVPTSVDYAWPSEPA